MSLPSFYEWGNSGSEVTKGQKTREEKKQVLISGL